MSEFKKIEEKWQKKWEESKIFESNPDPKRPKFFINVAYPYMNGAPHLGHAYTFLRTDAYARFKRMQGFNVLFPQGFHATGEPILGVVERVKNGDRDQIEALRSLGATDDDIKKFGEKGAEFVVNYWMDRWIKTLKSAGFSIDWRRKFVTALTPAYNRFIQWQYNTLKEKGYVVQGTHPVVWCPHDQSPTGDHDRLVGEGEGPVEYIIIKFEMEDGTVLPCATMRPETVYGVTNIWIRPEGEYVKTKVDGRTWIVGRSAATKLADQLHSVKIGDSVKGMELVGKIVKNPVTGIEVPVFPASFVDPETATGIVMSVPSHAPYDWIGLHDLKKNPEEAERMGVTREMLSSAVPISIIRVDGMSDNPAIDICSRMMISSQKETKKLDEATSEVYKKEFHLGILKENTEYPGMKVSEVKQKISADFIKKGLSVPFWETTSEVVCRCKTRCHVKILENQWFLKFSDEKWKKNAKEAISKMKIYPEISRTQFLNTVDWLKDKACARKSGLGTKLPWDEEWIVETLSDSVIYMAYYTISHVIEKRKVDAEKLTDRVFDYIFLGKGSCREASKESGLDEKIIEEMKEEFDYFYPTDMRFSAKELIQNHLTYHIFHHVAIWDNPVMWPRGISANGFVTLNSQKMSKRFGNVKMLADMIETYGADVTRMNLVGSNENMDDADWREEGVGAVESRIRFMWRLAHDIKLASNGRERNQEKWLRSRIQDTIDYTTSMCEETKFRSAINSAFYMTINDIERYVRRCGGIEGCDAETLRYALSIQIRLLAPFMPHMAEEIWSALGNDGLVLEAGWPRPEKSLIDRDSEAGEEMIDQILEDVSRIETISKIKARKITVIVAPEWKFRVYKAVTDNKAADLKKILSLVGEKNEQTVKYIQALQKKRNELLPDFIPGQKQIEILSEAKAYLERELSAQVFIEDAETSKLEKARNADVRKPAIFIE
jgi:leucyl-tRNA synthetase